MKDSQPQEEQQNHIRYVAALRQPHNEELGVEAECCLDVEQRDPIVKFAHYKLKSVKEVSMRKRHCRVSTDFIVVQQLTASATFSSV